MKKVTYNVLDDISNEECPSETILQTNLGTELHIKSTEEETVIGFPYGNRFDIIDGRIIVKSKN